MRASFCKITSSTHLHMLGVSRSARVYVAALEAAGDGDGDGGGGAGWWVYMYCSTLTIIVIVGSTQCFWTTAYVTTNFFAVDQFNNKEDPVARAMT